LTEWRHYKTQARAEFRLFREESTRICGDFGCKFSIFSGEKTVENALKSISILLTKRSKKALFESR
jgi:hypothetical protein